VPVYQSLYYFSLSFVFILLRTTNVDITRTENNHQLTSKRDWFLESCLSGNVADDDGVVVVDAADEWIAADTSATHCDVNYVITCGKRSISHCTLHWGLTSLSDFTFAEPIRWAKVRSKYIL